MFAKIENWKLLYVTDTFKEWLVSLSKEQHEILENWWFYIDWKFIKRETSKEEKETEIKQKYQDLIFEKYSLTDQLNMTNETLLITALAKYENRDFTEDEVMNLLINKDVKDWIDEQRKACQLEIENLSTNQ